MIYCDLMLTVRRITKWASILLIAGSAIVLICTLAWATRLDNDNSFTYECCTQEANAAFHAHYWSVFTLAAKIGFTGCAGLAMTLSGRATRKIGIWTVGVAAALLPFSILMVHSGWFGATVGSLIVVVFCSGVEILTIGAVRLAWEKFHHPLNHGTA